MTVAVYETVVLRRELHEMATRIDSIVGVVECMRVTMDSMKMDVLSEKARADSAIRQRDEVHERLDGQIRCTKALASLLSENNIKFDEIELAESTHTRDEKRAEKAEKELDDEKKRGKRTSNSNTPPSMGSDAQSKIAKYCKKNAENYLDEE